jgi:5-methylcytosine-specific restriction protein A
MMFVIGQSYTKNQIYDLLKVPVERRRGAWDKGVRKYDDEFFLFANIGTSGRTGHDYRNFWDGDYLRWQGSTGSNIRQSQIKELISGLYKVYVFTRTSDKAPFNYEGLAKAKTIYDKIPVEVEWEFSDIAENRLEHLPEEVVRPQELWEGVTRQITVNVYERNPLARRICIEHFGVSCQVCGFNFQLKYGELGKEFIHVHHIVPLHTINEKYTIDPLKDLVPLCANCHAMIHRRTPPLTVLELKSALKD